MEIFSSAIRPRDNQNIGVKSLNFILKIAGKKKRGRTVDKVPQIHLRIFSPISFNEPRGLPMYIIPRLKSSIRYYDVYQLVW
jgi:hypothetical protein